MVRVPTVVVPAFTVTTALLSAVTAVVGVTFTVTVVPHLTLPVAGSVVTANLAASVPVAVTEEAATVRALAATVEAVLTLVIFSSLLTVSYTTAITLFSELNTTYAFRS